MKLRYFSLLLSCLYFFISPTHCEANEARLHKVYALDEVHALRMNEKFDEALIALESLLENTLITPYERGWGLHEKACLFVWKQKYTAALEIFDEILNIYASYDDSGVLIASALYDKSKVLSKIGQHEEAIALLNEAMLLAKYAQYDNFDPRVRVLQMAIRMGRYLFVAGEAQAGRYSLEDTIAKLEDLANDNIVDMQPTIFCELSVAYKESVSIYLALDERELAIKSAEKALEKAKLAHPDDENHTWVRQMEKLLENTKKQS